MEIIIKIPEEEYNYILKSDNSVFADCVSKECMMHAIKKGTPLPKGHGKLIDTDELLTVTEYDGKNEKTYVPYDAISNASTIIEADEESE